MAMRTDRLEDLTRRSIARDIKRRREAMGLSQGQIASLIGSTRTGISQVENGHRNLCIHTMVKIALALGCTLAFRLEPINGGAQRRRGRKR